MKLNDAAEDRRAISPVIGVLLMVAVTAGLAAGTAVIVFDIGDSPEAPPDADIDVSSTDNGVEARLLSGDGSEEVRLESESGENTTIDEPGESSTLPTDEDVEVIVDDGDSEQVVDVIPGEDEPEPEPEPISDEPECDEVDIEFQDGVGKISTAEELQCINEQPWGDYKLVNDINLDGTEDWNDGDGFDPLKSFSGELDGQGHEITNMVIDRPYESDTGLFRQLDHGVIKNIGLDNAEVYGENQVGSLAGAVTNGEIENVYVSDASVEGTNRIGGAVGDLGESSISNSYVAVDVDADGQSANEGAIAGAGHPNQAELDYVYWDEDRANGSGPMGSASPDGEIGLTTDEMSGDTPLPEEDGGDDTMSGFDFDDEWTTTEGYPIVE